MFLHIVTFLFFFFNDTATTEIYTLSLHDALPISGTSAGRGVPGTAPARRPGGLEYVSPRARACAALCVHAARSSHGVPLHGRQLGDGELRHALRSSDAGRWLVAPLHGARQADVASVPAERRVRGAALSPPVQREADLRDAALWWRSAVGLAARSLRRATHRRDGFPLRALGCVRRRGSTVLFGALSSRVAATGAAQRDSCPAR